VIPTSKQESLRQLVQQKGRWSRPLTDEEKALGFLGWHERGYLPHCDFPDLTQLVTFRLADSLPASKRGEWEHLLSIEDPRVKRTKLEEYLDRGHGGCHLRQPGIAGLAEASLLYFHGRRYRLLAWCIMPNHVHVLVHVWRIPLWKLIRTWKRHVAAGARSAIEAETRMPGQAAGLRWQREYWDTFMRNAAQEQTAVRYIENNPVKARFCRVPADWAFSSARSRDVYGRLELAVATPDPTETEPGFAG
jgi:type I restriction enzyme R subunit/putative DNA methylase